MKKKEKEDMKENTKKKKQRKSKESIKVNIKKNSKESIKDNTRKKNIIFLVIAIIFIIIVVIIKLLINKNQKIIINKSVDIEIGGYNQVAMINYIIKNTTINDNKYMLVNIDIENKKNIDSNTSYHQFYLVDVNDNEVSPCYHGGMVSDSDYSNVFPNIIKANSHTSGNLYCLTDDRDIRQFKIKVISGGTIDANNKVNYEYSDYFVDLKK